MRVLLAIICLVCSVASLAQVIPVTVEQGASGWQIMREGKPYYIKGAGGIDHMDVTVACGANSIRTWGIDNAKQVLDEAHARGLTVMLGFWMAHERHGFNYSDEWAVEDQFKRFKRAVEEFKDHPALLMWGVGNEMDLFYSDFNVWDAVERIAAMIHEVDPNHPTCVVTAGIDVAEVQMIKERAPSIDILGVNTYGDLGGLPKKIDLFGWEGPYAVTEWGPNGHWEVAKTEWGSPIEQSSYEKARVYEERYHDYIEPDKEQCVGSYVFLWGQKQETTTTWYGMFRPDGSKTEAVDVMSMLWKGEWPENRSPQILNMTVDGKTKEQSPKVLPSKRYEVKLDIKDPDNDQLSVEFEIIPESIYTKAGGDVEKEPKPIIGNYLTEKGDGAYEFKVPRASGPYRLFAFVRDGNGNTATCNVPFFIDR